MILNRQKTVAVGGAALMALSGLVASAATAATLTDTSACKTSQTRTFSWAGSK